MRIGRGALGSRLGGAGQGAHVGLRPITVGQGFAAIERTLMRNSFQIPLPKSWTNGMLHVSSLGQQASESVLNKDECAAFHVYTVRLQQARVEPMEWRIGDR